MKSNEVLNSCCVLFRKVFGRLLVANAELVRKALPCEQPPSHSRLHRSVCRASFLLAVLSLTVLGDNLYAVQMDWSGQFWFDQQWLNNTQLDRGRPAVDSDSDYYETGGAYIPGTGEKNTIFYSSFLRLKPKLVVNDSIHIKSEFQVGSPVYGFLGRNFPGSAGEQFNVTTSQKDNATLGVARFWASLITDFGTFELGRAPIHWGLGAVWNSGDQLFDRYQSTGDLVRFVGKFGNLYVSPSISKMAMGNSAAGAMDTAASASFPGRIVPKEENDDVTDFHLAVKYDNTEEDFDFGLMWTRRIGNPAQTSLQLSPTSAGSNRLNFNILDFYARKKLGRFTLGGEVPLFTGTVGGIDGSANDYNYKAVAVVFEGGYHSDSWDIILKTGHVPGQGSVDVKSEITGTRNIYISGAPDYSAVYLHKNYGLGLIMFRYNLYGLSANNPDNLSGNNLRSPYDNPIVNATYVSVNPTYKLDKWSFQSNWVAAWADETAGSGQAFYNHNRRQFFKKTTGAKNQRSFMGWEIDLGAKFQWDENFFVSWTGGLFFPGPYWEFSNHGSLDVGVNSFMFTSVVQTGITF